MSELEHEGSFAEESHLIAIISFLSHCVNKLRKRKLKQCYYVCNVLINRC